MTVWEIALAQCDCCGRDDYESLDGMYETIEGLVIELIAEGWDVEYVPEAGEFSIRCPECQNVAMKKAMEASCRQIPLGLEVKAVLEKEKDE